MRLIALFIAIMIVVAFVFGFDFSVYKVSDLEVYPNLDFQTVVPSFSDASAKGIKTVVPVLSAISNVAIKGLQFILGTEGGYIQGEDYEFYYDELLAIWDSLTWHDAFKIWFVELGILPLDTLEDLYSKYIDTRGGVGGEF